MGVVIKNPLVSIITVCFNSALTIKDTIESVLNQTYQNIEYILIDGNSIDDTVLIIESFQEQFQQQKIHYKWISEPDEGIYDAFNKGLKLAKGNWISFLGSDDTYIKNAIELYIENIPNNKVDLLYSDIIINNRKRKTSSWSWKKFRRNMTINHIGALHNKEYFKKYGMFNTSYQIAGDYELLLRTKENLKTYKLDKVTAIMAEGGISNSDIKKVYLETTRAKRETANVPPLICQLDYHKWMLKYHIKKLLYALVR